MKPAKFLRRQKIQIISYSMLRGESKAPNELLALKIMAAKSFSEGEFVRDHFLVNPVEEEFGDKCELLEASGHIRGERGPGQSLG